MTRPTTTGKAQDLITFTRSTTGTALAKISYGEELVTNGDFSSDSDWQKGSNTTIVNGEAVFNGALSYVYQNAVTVGKLYFCSVTVNTWNSGAALSVGSSATGAGTIYSNIERVSNTTTEFYFTAQTTTLGIGSRSFNVDGSIDNISVKEVLYDQPDGTLQLFNHPINKPRIEYDAEGNCLGLLVEEARTNRVTYSQDFTQSYWAKNDLTVAPAPVAAPDGTMTATHVVKTGSNAHLVRTNVVSTADRHSIWARTVSGTGTMYIGGTAPDMLVTVTDEWQRLDVQCNNPHVYAASLRTDATLTEVYIWGSQAETGSFPTSYIPTSGSAVTRAADVASLAVSEFGYNQDQGTVVATGSTVSTVGAGKEMINLNDGTNSNYMQLNKTAFTNQTRARFFVITGNTTQAQIFSAVGSVSAGSVNKHAGAFQKNDFAFVFDGSLKGVDTVGEVPPVTTVTLGASATSAQQLNGHIKSVQYYPLRLSNAQLQALTV